MQHYPLSCVETSSWCKACGKMTMHRVAGRKLGACIECWKKLDQVKAQPAKPPVPEQTKLF